MNFKLSAGAGRAHPGKKNGSAAQCFACMVLGGGLRTATAWKDHYEMDVDGRLVCVGRTFFCSRPSCVDLAEDWFNVYSVGFFMESLSFQGQQNPVPSLDASGGTSSCSAGVIGWRKAWVERNPMAKRTGSGS